MTRAICYVRCSTEDQKLGPEAQRDSISRWASAHSVEIVAWHSDLGVSGAADLDKRPGLLDAIGDLRRLDASVLVVLKRDRLARGVHQAAMVQHEVGKAGASIVCADGNGNGETPEDRLMCGLLDLFAEYERAVIKMRIRAALKIKRERGEPTNSTPPYGWRHCEPQNGAVSRWERCPSEYPVREMILAERLSGVSVAQLVRDLDDDPGAVPRGSRWHRKTVERILAYEPGEAM